MALLIPADGGVPTYEVRPRSGETFCLEEWCELLSCSLVETRQLSGRRLLVMDEEAKLVGKPRNERATQLAEFPTVGEWVAYEEKMRRAGLRVVWIGEPLMDQAEEVDYVAGGALLCARGEWE